ncbi:MAG: hypothetical protein WA766_17665 [Candidatus Acidiferrales bacterium]
MSKYKVPEGGLKAALESCPEECDKLDVALILQAFVRWLSENPIPIPPDQDVALIRDYWEKRDCRNIYGFVWEQTQRRMFLAPDEEHEWVCPL